ncbi:hypothetical protein T492DRAFT_940875 [Pavlovales sp. CCMP2436]|nr:hypothetical protein T492DRAFT_940875 [Pavlovales sp. CCMP2436]
MRVSRRAASGILFNNELTGPIPSEIGELTALFQLQLQDNQLCGPEICPGSASCNFGTLLAEISDACAAQALALGDAGKFAFLAKGALTVGANVVISSGRVGSVGAMTSVDPINGATTEGAVVDMEKAYDAIAGIAEGKEVGIENSMADGLTFSPGVYKTELALNVVADAKITLSGSATDVFVFKVTAATFGARASIVLTGGALAKNVYWHVAVVGALFVGASAVLSGTFLVEGAATVGEGAQLTGRILSGAAITVGAAARITIDA